MNTPHLVGPFSELVTMRGLPAKGPIKDHQLEIIKDAGVLIEGEMIKGIGDFMKMKASTVKVIEIEHNKVAIPGLIDPHTHICFSGSRANDYAMRIAGKSYQEIAQNGGGIWQTVQSTREATLENLAINIINRADQLLISGVTTAEVKSGYGLDLENELKMFESIKIGDQKSKTDLIPTCLAAHIIPKDYDGDSWEYLDFVLMEMLPKIKEGGHSERVDIFIEEGAFGITESVKFLQRAKQMGFDVTIHGDQFHPGGSKAAIEVGAISVDHLESSTEKEISALSQSNVISTVLPGASLGLGMQYAPARKLLDAGNCLAIGSDWNPGSAPMGNLLIQSALMSASEKLSNAETFAGITIRAAKALNLHDRGSLDVGKIADLAVFPCRDYREILYHQGMLKPNFVLKKGEQVYVSRN